MYIHSCINMYYMCIHIYIYIYILLHELGREQGAYELVILLRELVTLEAILLAH